MFGNSALRRPAVLLLLLSLLPAPAPASPFVIPPLSESPDPDRAFIDIPLAHPDDPPAALAVAFAEPAPVAAVRAVTFHLRSGDGWLAAQIPPERARGTLRLPFGDFAPDPGAGPADGSDLLRVSLWRRGPDSDTPPLAIDSAALVPGAPVLVLRASGAAARGEDAFAAQMAARLERLLARAGIPFDTAADSGGTPPSLPRPGSGDVPATVLLPYHPHLSRDLLAALHAHVRAGGRVVAFYNPSADLSALLGLDPPRYRHDVPGWGGMLWNGRRVPHRTENLHLPSVPAHSRHAEILATWTDPDGADTRLPAVAATPHGALFAHVPPLATPAAQDLLRTALLGRRLPDSEIRPAIPAWPGLVAAWVPAQRLPSRIPPALNTLYAYLSAIPSSTAGGRSTAGRHVASGSRSAAGAQVASGSRSADSSAVCTAGSAAVHIWLPLLNPVDRPDAGWLDPASPATRAAVLRRVRAAASRHPAGIHFDYLRTAEGVAPSPEAAAAVTKILREAAALARDLCPSAVLSAAVFPTPAAAAAHNQDWPAWLREDLLDYVVPMIYEDDPDAFRAALSQCLAAAPADRLVAGIGTGADEAQVDAAAFAAELSAAVQAGLRGVAFFAFDDALLELLPAD